MRFETILIQLEGEVKPHLKVFVVEPTESRLGLLISLSSAARPDYKSNTVMTRCPTPASTYTTTGDCGFHPSYPRTMGLEEANSLLATCSCGVLLPTFHEDVLKVACQSLDHLARPNRAYFPIFFGLLGCEILGFKNNY